MVDIYVMGAVASTKKATCCSNEFEQQGYRWKAGCSKEDMSLWLRSSLNGCMERERGELQKRHEMYEHIDGVTYLLYKQIGSGECSEVWEARKMSGNGRYAIKIYRSRHIEKHRVFREEVKLLRSLGSECREITRLHGVSEQFDPESGTLEIKMVLDLCTGGSFRSLLRRSKSIPPLSESLGKVVAVQLLRALLFLHTKRIVHGDLKPNKILVEDTMGIKVKLSDFGVAAQLIESGSLVASTDDAFLPPEVAQGHPYTRSGDLWTLGLTLFQGMTGFLPMVNNGNSKVVPSEIKNVIKRSLGDDRASHLSLDALLFLDRLLDIDPNRRGSVVEALNHRWLRISPGTGGGSIASIGTASTTSTSTSSIQSF